MSNLTPQTNPVPLTVLTGFLGAGKTTLLKRILTGDHGLRAAVLVNDFGAINIDAELIVNVEENVISLANGCVCCSIRDDLTAAIEDLMQSAQPPEYIILEASGIADPAGIAITFSTESYARGAQLDSIICVLDAEQVFDAPEQMPLKLGQIAAADLIILNKVDLAGTAHLEKVRVWLQENFYRHRVIESTHCDVPMAILLASGRFSPIDAETESAGIHSHDCTNNDCSHHEHDTTAFKTWTYESRSALSIGALEQVVSKLPRDIYRCKGVLNTAETPDRKTILQVVGKRVTISDGGNWYQAERSSRIVVIAASGASNLEALRDKFDQCLACMVYE